MSQQKEENITKYQNQIIILQSFSQKLINIRNEKKNTEILMNKPVYLVLSMLKLSKLSMFWSDYVKTKYAEKTKLCYMDTEFHFIHKNS